MRKALVRYQVCVAKVYLTVQYACLPYYWRDDDVVVGFATVLLDDWIGTGGVTRAWTLIAGHDVLFGVSGVTGPT
jgi:hypothetical protein